MMGEERAFYFHTFMSRAKMRGFRICKSLYAVQSVTAKNWKFYSRLCRVIREESNQWIDSASIYWELSKDTHSLGSTHPAVKHWYLLKVVRETRLVQ